MSVFASLCQPLQQALIRKGWRKLHPIQELAFEPIASGKNVLLVAPTAGGKTEAAFLPLLNRFYSARAPGIKILYIAPLRALLNNIELRLTESRIAEAVYLEVFKWHGDVSRSRKLAAIQRYPDILLTTPESMDVILASNYVNQKHLFEPLQATIIDEAHYFAGIDRGGQLVSLLARLQETFGRDIQRVCLSATVGNPDAVLDWFSDPSRRPRVVVTAPEQKRERVSEIRYYRPADAEAEIDEIVTASQGKKNIIFVPSRKRAEQLSGHFHTRPTICHVHHGSIDKFWREQAEKDLAEARQAATVIATSTLELGIDVGDLDLIRQLGRFPNVSSYLQRIGRTGRRVPPQRCIAHVSDDEEFLINLAIISLAKEGYVEHNLLPRNFYHLLLQQLIVLILGNNGFQADKAWTALQHCSAFSEITQGEFGKLLVYWVQEDILRNVGGLLLLGGQIEKRYGHTNYLDVYALFDSPRVFEVWYGRQAVGSLDSIFVLQRPSDFAFILAGKWWRVKEVDYDDARVYVEPILERPSAPAWVARGGREVSYDIAQRIKRLLLEKDDPPCVDDPTLRQHLAHLRRNAEHEGLSDTPMRIVFLSANICEVVNYAGHSVNILLALLAKKLRNWNCAKVGFESFQLNFGPQVSQNSHQAVQDFFISILSDKYLGDMGQLTGLIAKSHEGEGAKWLGWLPSEFRYRFLVPYTFDLAAAKMWLEQVHAESNNFSNSD